jgi:hypothetical protein
LFQTLPTILNYHITLGIRPVSTHRVPFSVLHHGPRPAVSPLTTCVMGHDLRSALQQTTTRATTCGQPFNKLRHGPRPAVSPSTNCVTSHDLQSAIQQKLFQNLLCRAQSPVVFRIYLPTILMGPAHSCKMFKFLACGSTVSTITLFNEFFIHHNTV